MREKMKISFLNFLLISTGILFLISVEGIVYHMLGEEFSLPWYIPLSVILAGIICSAPTLLLLSFSEFSKRQFIARLIIHLIILYGIIVGLGYLFSWYRHWDGFLFLTVGYLMIYAFVWVGSIWLRKREDKMINDALDEIRDEE